jgi:diguanylate cyclase
MTVLLACLPIMIIHSLAVSASSYRLVRKVQIQNRQLERLSQHDELTGLYGRRYWMQQADRLLVCFQRERRPASLLVLDVDHFKRINDRYGHGTGDDVLCSIGDLIRGNLPPDSHAGRLGGDEFVLAMPVDLASAQAVAEALRGQVESLQYLRHPDLKVSVSIGIAHPPEAHLGLREWIEAADRALYQAKHGGRNRTAGFDTTADLKP